jgi:hypothetical protein
MIREYKLQVQEIDGFCMPSAVQAILKRRGHEFAQKDIAKALAFNPKDLCSFENLQTYLETFNLNARIFYYNALPFNDLEIFLESYAESDEDLIIGRKLNCTYEKKHVWLVYDFENPDLYLINPADRRNSRENAFAIERDMWQKQEGVYCLVGWKREIDKY